MLTSLSLRNFKCFESVDVPLGRITVLIGPNGSGKSSVLHALTLLRQSLGANQLIYVGQYVDLASYADVVFKRDTNRRLELSYSAVSGIGDEKISYEYGVISKTQLERLSYSWNYREYQSDLIWTIDEIPSRILIFRDTTFTLHAQLAIGNHASIIGHVDESTDKKMYKTLMNIIDLPSRDIHSWKHTPTSRGFTRSSYQLLDKDIDEIVGNLESSSLASSLSTSIAYNDDARERISEWLRSVTGVQINSRVSAGIKTFISSRSQVANTGVTISNEGFGTNQLTYTLFQLAKTPPGGLNMIEEPELHLHPFAIARLADLLVDEAVRSDKQLLLTTHSEHLLLGLLNNVAEGKLPHTDLVVLSTHLEEDGAHVDRVKINEEGLAEGGLPGFFDATLEAQRRHLNALMQRG